MSDTFSALKHLGDAIRAQKAASPASVSEPAVKEGLQEEIVGDPGAIGPDCGCDKAPERTHGLYKRPVQALR